jgi:hypothetical protein
MDSRTLKVFALLAPLVTACGARDVPVPQEQSSVPSASSVPLVPVPPAAARVTADALNAVRTECLGYDSTVVLSGVLRRETHPGPPTFESIADGDRPQTGFYLHLSAPTCTNADRSVPDGAREDSVTRVQLILDSAGYATFRPLIDRRVRLSGVLFSSFTGHHHAPLLLRDVIQVR